MGRLLAVVALVAAGALAAPAADAGRYERQRLGLSIAVPAGWSVVENPLTACTDPVQRVALRGHGSLVQIVERLGRDLRGFPERPRRFALDGRPEYIACCSPAQRRGWFLSFRDAGRGFYAYVYVGQRSSRSEVLRILDSFRVRPLGRSWEEGLAKQALGRRGSAARREAASSVAPISA